MENENRTFFKFLEDNYNTEKDKLKKICSGFNNILFDEDIFHDTIIKIDSTLNRNLKDNEYHKYLCKSYRTTLVRDKLYFRNSMTDHTFDFDGIEPFTRPYVDATIDLCNVINILDKKFGVGLTKFYVDWLSGYNIKEAMSINNIDSGYYYIKQMTDYIRRYNINGRILY